MRTCLGGKWRKKEAADEATGRRGEIYISVEGLSWKKQS